MSSRTVAIPLLLAGTVAGPYVAHNLPGWTSEGAQASATAPSSPGMPGGSAGAPATPIANRSPGAAAPGKTPLEGVPAYSLADVLRFDVTKEWVYQRWPRKSTALAQLDLFGVRVPLVTGTQLPDLAGSLTYFFDQSGRVQRISFHGRTADTTQIVNLVTQRYRMVPQPTPIVGEQLLQERRGNDVLSELRTRPAPVLWATSLHDSFSVDLELQDPATARPIPPPQVALPKPLPPEAVQAKGASAAKGAEAKAEGESSWDAWFPRSRASESQIRQLDDVNLSR